MKRIDLNSDMGEGFGAYKMGDDAAMLRVVTTANVACGFHAGDPEIMAATFAAARKSGVAVGAHPSFPDLWGFGRRRLPFTEDEITRLVAYQIGAAAGVAALAGHRITHVKAHGALSNIAAEHAGIAKALARATAAVDPSLVLLAVAGTELERAAADCNLAVAREIFADRAYLDDGNLMPRSRPGSVIHDAKEAARRTRQMVEERALVTESGKRLPVEIDTVCVHGDTPGAVEIATAVRRELEQAGFVIKPFVAP